MNGNFGVPVLVSHLKDEFSASCWTILTETGIFFKHGLSSMDSFIKSINLKDVSFIHPVGKFLEENMPIRALNKKISRMSLSGSHGFVIFEVDATSNEWNILGHVFWCSTDEECSRWVAEINERISKCGSLRPHQLLVFINPNSGRKKAERIYKMTVAPLLRLAGIKTDVIVTTHRGHMTEHLLSHPLDCYDGVICVGGDGFLAEAIQGLLLRERCKADLDLFANHLPGSIELPTRMKIGVIPAGSTDTVVFSTQGINDVLTATLHIILGDDLALDVAAVHSGENGDFIRYALSMVGYGFHADLLKNDDKLRWMGPKRYDYSGFSAFLSLSSYMGEISYLPSANQTSHSTDGVRCSSGCSVCGMVSLTPNSNSPSASSQFISDSPSINGSISFNNVNQHTNVNALHRKNSLTEIDRPVKFYVNPPNPVPLRSRSSDIILPSSTTIQSEFTKKRCQSYAAKHTNKMVIRDSRDRTTKGSRQKKAARMLSESLDMPLLSPSWTLQGCSQGWRTVRAKFVAVNAFIQSCRCLKSIQGPAPWAHLGDGCLDLIIIRDCSHRQFLQYLLRIATSRHGSHHKTAHRQFDLPFVSVHRVCAFRFKPLTELISSDPTFTSTLPDVIPTTTTTDRFDKDNSVNLSLDNLNESKDRTRRHRKKAAKSLWCTDGETVQECSVSVYVHRQLIRLFARGPCPDYLENSRDTLPNPQMVNGFKCQFELSQTFTRLVESAQKTHRSQSSD